MDIVQYLHGLVSSSMGISNEDASADLLKQYYALSVAHLIELDGKFDIANPKLHSLNALWDNQGLLLAQRLARSFHMDEQQTAALLKAITPPMMIELANLAGGVGLVPFLIDNFEYSRTHMPAWSSQFIKSSFIQKTQESKSTNTNQLDDTQKNLSNDPEAATITPISNSENTQINDNSESINNNIADNPANHKPTKPKMTHINPLFMGLGLGLLILIAGGSAWYFSQNNNNEPTILVADDPNVAKPTIENLNPPRLSLTSGENGTLYACGAEVGNSDLQTRLLDILQKNFGQIGCIMDIDDDFGTSLTGLERLESIIAMVKSEPFTSIEIIGNHIYVNTPKVEVLPRLTNDISLLAPQFEVSPVPAFDKNMLISQSLERATTALNILGNPPNNYDLSRAASLIAIDFNGNNEIPTNVHGVLSLVSEKLAQNPNTKLIIVAHTSGGNDAERMKNLALSAARAEAVKTFLVKNGANESQLVPKGVGDAFPASDNLTDLGRFKNARVEFLVFDESTMSALNVDMTQMVAPASTIDATIPQTQVMQTPIQATQVPVHNMPTPSMPIQNMPMQTMPVQGMPDGNYLPQSVEQAHIVQAPTSYGYIGSAPPPATPSSPELPNDFIELSDATISSEQSKRNEQELRQ